MNLASQGFYLHTHLTVCIIHRHDDLHIAFGHVRNTDAPDRIVGCLFVGGSVMYGRICKGNTLGRGSSEVHVRC